LAEQPAGRRLIVGNLDLEVELTGSAAPPLKRAVVEMISAAAATLSAFGGPDDLLWTPQPVAADRVLDGGPELVSGPLPTGPRAVLAWGEAPSVAALRAAGGPTPGEVASEADWRALLWTLHPAVEAARRCNHRALGFAVARELDLLLPGARLIESAGELEAHLAAGGAELSGGTWVVKAPLSASGRDRLRVRAGELDDAARARLDRLLARGPLLFEPWVDRQVDVGVCGLVTPAGHLAFPPHRLLNDAGGVFRGIELDDAGDRLGLTRRERTQLESATSRVARALRSEGYVGPFGIDAYTYRDGAGRRRFQALGEINARLTFGHVARAHAERLGCSRAAQFGLGRGEPPAGAEILLRPAAPDRTAAWLVTAASRPR
jgi:hypothetical protein